jgi:hypothetical protein
MGWAVLDAARQAWEWHGLTCYVRPSDGEVAGIVGALDVPEQRHVEVFVEDVNDSLWSSIDRWQVSDAWVMRAVVPLPVLGQAHEALRERGCELQAYWVQDDGQVAFGSVQIA